MQHIIFIVIVLLFMVHFTVLFRKERISENFYIFQVSMGIISVAVGVSALITGQTF